MHFLLGRAKRLYWTLCAASSSPYRIEPRAVASSYRIEPCATCSPHRIEPRAAPSSACSNTLALARAALFGLGLAASADPLRLSGPFQWAGGVFAMCFALRLAAALVSRTFFGAGLSPQRRQDGA